MVAMATFLSYRISAISTFCRPTTRTPSITNRLVAIAYTKRVIANCIPKLVAMATSLSTSWPHLTHDFFGPSEPTTQTASRLVLPFLHKWPQSVPILYNALTLPPQNCISIGGSSQRLRSASRHQLMVPRHRRTIFGRRAFSVAGPTAWNSLPDYLRDPSLSEDTFRRLLKTYLFELY